MELELGLSMSNYYNCVPHKISSLKELDLISYVNCEAKQDDLSSLSCESSSVNNGGDYDQEEMNYVLCKKKRSRRFFEAESSEFCHQSKTLSLLFWDKQPNEDDNIPNTLCNSEAQVITKNEGDDIVGWPPVKTYRKRQNYGHQRQQCGCHGRNMPMVENGGCRCGGSGSLYVKVQLEGCFITRKINLKLYHSYDTLTSSLFHMFGKGEDRMDDYKLTYQDGEGNWLLVGDNVPWRTLIQTVRRLKMVRKDC